MTFAELVLLLVIGVLLYRLMRPLQRALEVRFYKFFRTGRSSSHKPVVDITDYAKRKDSPNDT